MASNGVNGAANQLPFKVIASLEALEAKMPMKLT